MTWELIKNNGQNLILGNPFKMVGKTESIIGSGLLKAMPYLDITEITIVEMY